MSKLQKFLPFLLPILAIIVIVIVALRWYNKEVEEVVDVPSYSEGLAIENLSAEELTALDAVKNKLGDYETLALTGTGANTGEVRYLFNGDKVMFTMVANLEASATGYRLWFLGSDNQLVRSQNLVEGKGGYTVSLVLPQSTLPVSLYVLPDNTSGETADVQNYLLFGTLTK